VELERISVAEQRPGNNISASTNVNKGILMTTQKNGGTARHVDFYPGRMAAIKGSAFVNSKVVEISPKLVRDSS
jgi:hypothetical protein